VAILNGKTAIITGGAAGIGLAIARCFHGEGANVVICDIRGDLLPEASAKLSNDGKGLYAIRADVTSENDIKLVVEAAVEKFGRIDILVNNAGIGASEFGRLDQTPPSVWNKIMRINAYAPWRFMVAVLPEMRKMGGGSIINISSINGIKPYPRVGIYCTSKAALQMLSQVMAMEVASDNIRVNLILPGLVEDTEFRFPGVGGDKELADFYDELRPLHPLGRNAKPLDIAHAALFLASDLSEYITGVLFNVDGGRHMATNRPPHNEGKK
jgi:NAD(P)-dependent dehydrogenase (short-subunit alcohol dehydrogenase family)